MSDDPIAYTSSVALSVTSSSSGIALPFPGMGQQIRLSTSAATSDCRVTFGYGSLPTAVIPTPGTPGGVHIPTGIVEVGSVPKSATHIAAIATTATTLYIMQSNGL